MCGMVKLFLGIDISVKTIKIYQLRDIFGFFSHHKNNDILNNVGIQFSIPSLTENRTQHVAIDGPRSNNKLS